MEKRKALNPEDLNRLLGRCDSLLADRGIWQKNLVELLVLRDEMEDLAEALEGVGSKITSQRNAMRTVDGVLRHRRGTMARELANPSLAKVRAEKKPPRHHWWWYSDILLREERKANFLRWARVALIVLGIFTVVLFALQKISEKSAKAFAHLREVENLYQAGDYAKALAEAQAAIDTLPQQPTAYIWQSIIYGRMGGHEAESGERFARAVELYGNETQAYLDRGVIFYQLGDLDASRQDVDTVLRLDPESGQGHLLLANLLVEEGKWDEAEAAIQDTLKYAKGDAGTEVMAKILLARIMETPRGSATPTPGR